MQYVIRPQTAEHPDYRGYAGQIASGVLRVGDAVTVLPSGRTSTVEAIDALGQAVDVAWAPQSVTLRLADDLDISRGDLIAPTASAPGPTRTSRRPSAMWHDRPLKVGDRVLLKHTTRTVKAIVKDIPSRLTLDDLSQHPAPGELVANDIGRIVVRTAEPLAARRVRRLPPHRLLPADRPGGRHDADRRHGGRPPSPRLPRRSPRPRRTTRDGTSDHAQGHILDLREGGRPHRQRRPRERPGRSRPMCVLTMLDSVPPTPHSPKIY